MSRALTLAYQTEDRIDTKKPANFLCLVVKRFWFLSAAPNERVAAETNPLLVIGSLGPQRVLDTPCLDSIRLTRQYVTFTPQRL